MDLLSLTLPILATLITLFLGGFVFLSNPKSKTNKVFSMFALGAAFWVLSVMLADFSKDIESALFWTRMSIAGPAIFSPLFLYLSYIFPQEKRKIKLQEIILLFLPSLLFLVFIPTEHNVERVWFEEWGTNFAPGALYYLLIVYILSYFILAFTNLSKSYRVFSGIKKAQLQYIFFGFFTGVIIGITTNAIFPLLGYSQLSSVGPAFAMFGLTGFTAYAITQYRFMDITVATGKVVTYFFTFLSLGVFGYIAATLFSYFNVPQTYQIIIVTLLAGTLFKPLLTLYEKLSSRYLYHSFYSSQKVLGELSERLTKILDIDELADLTTKTIMGTMKIDRAVILLRDKKTGKFDVKRNFGFKEENGISLVSDNFLTEHLQKTQKPLVYEELSLMIDSTEKEMEKRKIKKLKKNMERIEAALCNLLVSRGEIIGMIVLGEKISKDPYTDQDVDLIDSLCKQISVSVENAKLYTEVQDLSQNLEKKVDEQIRELKIAYKKLQRIDKAKTEFMSIVSHQLRTPLSIIKGHLSMLNEGAYENDEEKKKKVLNNVYETNERLIALVNDVLNISRIQAGRVELTKEKADIKKITKETVEKMMKMAEDKGVGLVFHEPEDKLPEIEVDISKIENVLLNLIDNALKYTKEGSVEVALKEEDESVLIEIEDTGEGMKKEEIEKLFATFSRGDAGKKHWIQGSGLGLYIARQFVGMHGGKIWAYSEGEGKGSQFYVRLPQKRN